MRYSALIGNPTEHSISPLLFEWIAARLSPPLEYKHLKVNIFQVSDLNAAINAFQTLGFCGLNVTRPYKLDIVSLLDRLDSSVLSIGAVNTIVFDGERNWSVGYNTDWCGIYTPLKKIKRARQKQNVIIFGAGGAARAAIYACLKLNVRNITVLHRSTESERTKSVKGQFSDKATIHFDTYEHIAQYIGMADVIINATPMGMTGQDSGLALRVDLLKDSIDFSDKVFLDCVYNPVETPLLSYFKSKEATTIDGLWMMIYQGLYAFSLWTGIDVLKTFTRDDLDKLHSLLKDTIPASNNSIHTFG